jgi:hypothetical protein
MKCIKSIKESYQNKVGEYKRVSDKDAEDKVKTGNWVYISKTEYKENTRVDSVKSENNKPKTKNEKVSKKTRMVN